MICSNRNPKSGLDKKSICRLGQGMKLFDTHCHIQDEKIFSNAASIIEKAVEAGISKMVCCGTSEDDWPLVSKLCTSFSELIPSFGLHPWYIRKRSKDWQKALEGYLSLFPAAVVGEIGLDHAIEPRDDDAQQEVFKAQLQTAIRLKRPVSIHCRKAWEALILAIDETGPLCRGFAIHSYSGSADLIPGLAEKGAFFSFSGSLTLSGNKRARKSASFVPPSRLLIETDAPDMPPVIDGKRVSLNEPANLIYVFRELADIRKISADELAGQLWENSCRLFV